MVHASVLERPWVRVHTLSRYSSVGRQTSADLLIKEASHRFSSFSTEVVSTPASPGPVTSARPPIRVLLADDAYLVRMALKHLFEGVSAITIVGESEDGSAVPRLVDEQRADVLITDIRMPPAEDEGIVWRLISERLIRR